MLLRIHTKQELWDFWRKQETMLWNTVNKGAPLAECPEVTIPNPEWLLDEECQPGDTLAKLDVECGAYERVRRVHEGDVVIDAGAHIGWFTQAVAERARTVIAIEPHPRNVSRIFALKLKNVTTLCGACWSESWKTLRLNLHLSSVRHSVTDATDSFGSIEVKSIGIDSLGLSRLDFMKVDVEGAEPQLLRGAALTIQHCRPFIVMDVDEKELDEVLTILHEFNYEVAGWHEKLIGLMRHDGPVGTCTLHCVPKIS